MAGATPVQTRPEAPCHPRDSARHLKAPEGVSLHGVDTVAQAMAVLDLLPSS